MHQLFLLIHLFFLAKFYYGYFLLLINGYQDNFSFHQCTFTYQIISKSYNIFCFPQNKHDIWYFLEYNFISIYKNFHFCTLNNFCSSLFQLELLLFPSSSTFLMIPVLLTFSFLLFLLFVIYSYSYFYFLLILYIHSKSRLQPSFISKGLKW